VALEVSNVSNIANATSQAGFYRIINNKDTTNNLFDASKFIAFKSRVNQDSVAFRYVFNENNMAPLDTMHCTDTTLAAALPAKPGSKVKIPAGKYKYCRVYYTGFMPGLDGFDWPGPWSGIKIKEEWWLPDTLQTDTTKAWDPKFVLWCQTIYPKNVHRPTWWANNRAFDSTNTTLYIGKVMDWDIFAENGSNNYAWANKNVGVAWQQGTDTTDTILHQIPNGHYGFVAFLDTLGKHAAYAAHSASNNRYIYPQSGYKDEELYRIAADAAKDPTNMDTLYTSRFGAGFKYIPVDTTAEDTLPFDLNTVLTDTFLVPPYPDSITIYNVLGVIGDTAHGDSVKAMLAADRGCDSMANGLNRMRAHLGIGMIAGLTDSLNCKLSSCTAKPGEVNGNPPISTADIVYLVNYVFDKSRPLTGCLNTDPINCWLPSPLCRAEVNGNPPVSTADVVYLVNYVFDKSRPLTGCLNTDPVNCWTPVATGECCIPVQ
jgi:hypothetical protein